MWFLARWVVGPIVKLAVVATIVAVAATYAGLDPVAMLEQYLTNWFWSQI